MGVEAIVTFVTDEKHWTFELSNSCVQTVSVNSYLEPGKREVETMTIAGAVREESEV